MASSTAANTSTRNPTNQLRIPKPSTIARESTAPKSDTRCIDPTSFHPQNVLRELPTRNSRISAAAAAILINDDDERPQPLTLPPRPPLAVDATALDITLPPPLCNDVSFRMQLDAQTEELERMHQRWLLTVASLDSSHLAADAHPNPPPNHTSPDALLTRPPDATLTTADVLCAEVRSTDTTIDIILDKSTSILVEQTQQSKSLRHLLEMSEALIEGMNLIMCQLDNINSCLPPRNDFAQPNHPTPTTGKLGKSTILQPVLPTTQIQTKAVPNHANLLPRTAKPPRPPPRPVRPLNPPQSKQKSVPHKKTSQTKFPVNGRPSVPPRTKDCLRPP